MTDASTLFARQRARRGAACPPGTPPRITVLSVSSQYFPSYPGTPSLIPVLPIGSVLDAREGVLTGKIAAWHEDASLDQKTLAASNEVYPTQPASSEYGTYKTAKARFWSYISGKRHSQLLVVPSRLEADLGSRSTGRERGGADRQDCGVA